MVPSTFQEKETGTGHRTDGTLRLQQREIKSLDTSCLWTSVLRQGSMSFGAMWISLASNSQEVLLPLPFWVYHHTLLSPLYSGGSMQQRPYQTTSSGVQSLDMGVECGKGWLGPLEDSEDFNENGSHGPNTWVFSWAAWKIRCSLDVS